MKNSKTSGRKHSESVHDLRVGDEFLGTRNTIHGKTVVKPHFIKIYNSCYMKDMVKRKNNKNRKKRFAKHLYDKGLVSKICKELIKLNPLLKSNLKMNE